MSDASGRSRRIERLRRIAEGSLSAGGAAGAQVAGTFSEELWALIEQLEVENEELQRSRDEVEQLHRKFADLYEHAPVGYILLNERRIIVQANATARSFLGARAIDLERTALGPFIYADCQDEYFKALRSCRESGETASAEICIGRKGEKEGGDIWLQARISCHADGDGAVNAYRVILTDITERVAAQQNAEERRLQVEELLEEKELLLREIHHRVKNDFHLIGGFLSLQGANSDNPELQSAMEEAHKRVSVMARIYNVIHAQGSYSWVELNKLVEEIASGFESGSAGAEVVVTRQLEPVRARKGPALSLALVLNELLTNTSKYAFDSVDKPEISVRLHAVTEEEVELEVADNGVGMPEEVINGSRRGFGLTIADALAQQHQGSLSLENGEPREGRSEQAGACARVRMQRA